MRTLLAAIALLSLNGCLANNSLTTASYSERNVFNLAQLEVGMSEFQVQQVMHKPYSQRTFQVEKDIYDVWFYVTTVTALDQSRMVPLNLTPLAFKNKVLIGWGYEYYRWLLKEEEIERKVNASTSFPPKKKAPVEEDQGLEKALDQKQKPLTAMSKKPKTEKKKPEPPPEKKPPLSEEDEEMFEEESEQNFNYW